MSFDFDHAVQAPFRMQPGLRRLAPDAPTQLTPNRPGARHLREKIAVLQRWADQALMCQSTFDPQPALDTLARDAARQCPAAFTVDDRSVWHALWLGCSVSPEGTLAHQDQAWPEVVRALRLLPAPMRRAGLLALTFAEDLAIVNGRDATLPWLAVCLPSHWAPRDKVGRSFVDAHAPVADAERLRQAGAHLMKLVCGADRWERFVWTISDLPWLHTHPDRAGLHDWPADFDPDQPGQAWWRTERQTFIPVPELQQAVFTIEVNVTPLADAIATAAQARRLHDSLASMSEAVLNYRGLTRIRSPLLRWLAARAA